VIVMYLITATLSSVSSYLVVHNFTANKLVIRL